MPKHRIPNVEDDTSRNIQTHKNGFKIRMQIGGRYIFLPCFKTLEMATTCRDAYLEIAMAFDAGKRDSPTKAELKAIGDQIRTSYHRQV